MGAGAGKGELHGQREDQALRDALWDRGQSPRREADAQRGQRVAIGVLQPQFEVTPTAIVNAAASPGARNEIASQPPPIMYSLPLIDSARSARITKSKSGVVSLISLSVLVYRRDYLVPLL